VEAGLRVLMLERGDWVQRGAHCRDLGLAWRHRRSWSMRTPFHTAGERRGRVGSFHCVGGPSVYYGGVALRLREADFRGSPEISGDLRWPFEYDDLEEHYDRAERILGVGGDPEGDPTAPPRSRPSLPAVMPLSPTSRALAAAACARGLRPFRLPVALNDHGSGSGRRCVACGTCDGFACFIGAKNDLATVVIPGLLARGMALRTNTAVVRLEVRGRRVVAAEALDLADGGRLRFRGRAFVLAAGALATPHLLLASRVEELNPAGGVVGRFLMRHCNAIVAGPAPAHLGAPEDFRKQVGIHDFYFGGDAPADPPGKLGAIQQIRATRIGLAELPLPARAKAFLQPIVDRSLALLVISEDQPRPENRVHLDPRRQDALRRPLARLHHRYTPRDRASRRALERRACELLRDLGAPFVVRKPLATFSHALGTVRMGVDEARFPVAPDGRFRGLSNLWITDASVFPTAGGVNPSLTVAANALRVARGMVDGGGAPS
jgi:choline dehydrogenase-like flavoprotein